ncbi:MAG: class I SAM-dependent methyltransferase [Candidatus Omnitrophota bacterium]|jgi:ubiquinone/menaquinone biosynthesis C-methylase UbiE
MKKIYKYFYNKENSLEENNTKKKYSFLWSRYQNKEAPETYHFNHVQEVIPDKIVRGRLGIDIGCGCGWDTHIMAKDNPAVRIVGIDISEGISTAFRLNKNLENVNILKASALHIPLEDKICDFAYSFGVLHHLPDYKKGLLEIKRVLKKSSPCFLYLYEDHSERPIKHILLKLVTSLRKITIRIPARVLYIFSLLLSPAVVLFITYPAKFFKKFRFTYKIYENTPFNFGDSLFSLSGDLYDRFSAPIEHRFSRDELYKLFQELNFYDINITKLKATAGWVVWGYNSD